MDDTLAVGEDLRAEVEKLQGRAMSFFAKSSVVLKEVERREWYGYLSPDYYWSKMIPELQVEGQEIAGAIVVLGQKMAVSCRGALLVSDADLKDLVVAIKKMRAAVLLRQYLYAAPEEVYDSDRDRVIGFKPESQDERNPLSPEEAEKVWLRSGAEILRIYEMVDRRPYGGLAEISSSAEPVRKYKPNSAFIMMWMDPSQFELVDVRDAVSETFARFGVKAVRADEIEHEGVITQRILDEIRTSEFLFADLTGARPNVYYEVGYAHALGKRVILFRKKGAGLHFDLAGYNCPEYENLRDLKDKLARRLENVTNKRC